MNILCSYPDFSIPKLLWTYYEHTAISVRAARIQTYYVCMYICMDILSKIYPCGRTRNLGSVLGPGPVMSLVHSRLIKHSFFIQKNCLSHQVDGSEVFALHEQEQS